MANKPERNDPCHCGSGKKYKNCCMGIGRERASSKMKMTILVAAVILGLVIVVLALSGGNAPVDCPPGTVWSDAHQHCH